MQECFLCCVTGQVHACRGGHIRPSRHPAHPLACLSSLQAPPAEQALPTKEPVADVTSADTPAGLSISHPVHACHPPALKNEEAHMPTNHENHSERVQPGMRCCRKSMQNKYLEADGRH